MYHEVDLNRAFWFNAKKGGAMILVGDVGGTHTRLALFEKGKQVRKEEEYPSRKYKSLEEIIGIFLEAQPVERACFGVAGPVREGVCKATNLPWKIDAEQIGRRFQIGLVHLLNDLVAHAYGIRSLKKEDLFVVHPGVAQKGNQALIAAGTGLGEAGLFWDGKMHHPFACEGGHVDFAPRDALEVELWKFLQKKFPHVSYERVVSGPGLLHLFEFLIETGKEVCSEGLRAALAERDPSRVISEWGHEGKDRACVRALDWFLSLYGAEAGNMALKFLALGGVYVGGGIAPHLAQAMKGGRFHTSFTDKGRFKDLLSTIPIWVILKDETALLGAANYVEGI